MCLIGSDSIRDPRVILGAKFVRERLVQDLHLASAILAQIALTADTPGPHMYLQSPENFIQPSRMQKTFRQVA